MERRRRRKLRQGKGGEALVQIEIVNFKNFRKAIFGFSAVFSLLHMKQQPFYIFQSS